MEAILFVGHGSRDPEGNEEIRQYVDRIRHEMKQSIVETCFLEFEEPTIAQGIDTCVEKGATRVIVIPIILFPAGHSKIHIPMAIDEAKEKYPNVSFTYGRPLGIHETIIEILESRLEESGIDFSQNHKDTAVLILGRGSSDQDANSDLYKMSRLFFEKRRVGMVETAFIGVTDPLLDAGVERCLKLGAKHVVILPYFLFTGILIKRLENRVKEYHDMYPNHTFTLANYFGFHPLLKKVLLDRVEEATRDEVKMNCDTCQYRLEASEHMDHHDHHDHHHEHSHDHVHHEVHKS
ncbi:sirohydrochlorin chelatase [Massilibacterium senegalense]|uniref:sirohydrochlorin chelatase n=1 Tax=Massilibacterium senegalense TaxID=1632858 RepID=UPI0007840F12|nr:sirohydrochlorin chelatase [Massilibacterium senegalense]